MADNKSLEIVTNRDAKEERLESQPEPSSGSRSGPKTILEVMNSKFT
jgi:hypothetical protein